MKNLLSKEKLVLLHSIRGFAALIVVIAHVKFPFWSGGVEYLKHFPRSEWNLWDYFLFGIDMFTSNATVMVIIFFVLSGFFIAYSFENNKWTVKQFYTNRLIRIYTPYIASMILAVVLFKLAMYINPDLFNSVNPRQYNQDIIRASQNLNTKNFLYSLFFIPNPQYIAYNYPYWSLLVEAMFYIIAPFFIKKSKTFLFITFSFFILGRFFDLTAIPFMPRYVANFLTIHSIYFAMGYFMFWLLFDYKIQEKIKRINVWCFNLLAAAILLSSLYGGFFLPTNISYLLGGMFASVMIYRMIVYPVRITFISRFFISMGKISYTMYLIHVPIFIFLYSILVKFSGQEVFFSRIYWIPAIIAVLVSYPFYWLVEHQSLKLIKWYKSKTLSKRIH
ncbi:MAG: acyltransferase family protein [Bacteroidales bacterium]